ncbi:MAG: hypothetical protein ACK55I_42105, partial [bacterium]
HERQAQQKTHAVDHAGCPGRRGPSGNHLGGARPATPGADSGALGLERAQRVGPDDDRPRRFRELGTRHDRNEALWLQHPDPRA